LSFRFRSPCAREKAGIFLILFLSALGIFPQKVVSLAPGVTEIVFALGRGDKLVGVTKFCDYPAAASKINKIGGFLDINMEALVALAPDIVITYPEHAEKLAFLQGRAKIVTVPHGRLADLLQSILDIGRVLGAESEARQLVGAMRRKMEAIAARVKGRKKIRTLLIAGRNADELKNMYIIGKKDFINDLLEIAGGTNAYQGEIDYPSISLESVIFLNPEFIFEISAHYEGIADEEIIDMWRPYRMVTAVAKGQIRIITDSFWLRPGPRAGQIAEELAAVFARAGKQPANGNGPGHD
jgi:iron complex transport system substrate-binding protein